MLFMKKEQIWWIFFIIFGLLLISGIFLIDHSSKLNEYMDGNLYIFGFHLMTQDFNGSSNNRIHLQNYCFYYDFSKNKGNISFDLNHKNWSLSYIYIDFPSTIQINNFEIYSMKNGIKTDVKANIIKTEQNHFKISDFSQKFKDEKFTIEFDSNLQPCGTFSFFNNRYDHLMANTEQGNINFILGDDYECIGDCVSDLKYIEEIPKSSDRNIKLKLIDIENNNNWFNLNAAKRYIKWWKTFSMGLGISFVVASLNSIFILLYEDGIKNEFANLKIGFITIKDFNYEIKCRIYKNQKSLVKRMLKYTRKLISMFLDFSTKLRSKYSQKNDKNHEH